MGNNKGGSNLKKWQDRLRNNHSEYENELNKMAERDALYNGTKQISGIDGKAAKKSNYVRNIVGEIIEAEVDSSVPLPKVSAKRPEDEDRAMTIEAFLRNELDYLPFEKINDMDERTTPIQGGDFFLVEWDNDRHTHDTVGGLKVSLLHPRQVIPQAGVNNIQDMDYIFVLTGTTKKEIKRRYNVDVFSEDEEFPEVRSGDGDTDITSNELVTLVTAYYKNKNGGIGVYRWVGDTEVQSLPDYFARRLKYCKKCGNIVTEDERICPVCESRAFEHRIQETTQLDRDIDIEINGGQREYISQMTAPVYGDIPVTDETGAEMFDEFGNAMTEYGIIEEARPNEVPIYKLTQYPVILRRNISKSGALLGGSDVDSIKDQQEMIKKLGDKMQEKLLKGGSYVTFPVGVNTRKSDEELKVIELEDPSQKQMIDVLNIQANISNDMAFMDVAYQAARETIGITDSFQGRKDSTAQSGAAKQFAAAQTAGRLESKRVMKQAAYQELFEMMFKFMLAYADEPRATKRQNPIGDIEYGMFDRYNFLERDAAGELYWNDDFLFSVDTTNNNAQNREALWNSTKEAYQSRAFGDPANIDTRILYWATLERYHYPNAGNIKQNLKEQKEQQEAQSNEMQKMQNGDGNLQGSGNTGGVQGNLPLPQQPMPRI